MTPEEYREHRARRFSELLQGLPENLREQLEHAAANNVLVAGHVNMYAAAPGSPPRDMFFAQLAIALFEYAEQLHRTILQLQFSKPAPAIVVEKQPGQRWVVDEQPDANGYWTIRVADGSLNGNTLLPIIATVYDCADAEKIVSSHNMWLTIG